MADGKLYRFEELAAKRKIKKDQPALAGETSEEPLQVDFSRRPGRRFAGVPDLPGSSTLIPESPFPGGFNDPLLDRLWESLRGAGVDVPSSMRRFGAIDSEHPEDPISAAYNKLEDELRMLGGKKGPKAQQDRIGIAQEAFMTSLVHDARDNLEDLVGIDPRIGELRQRANQVLLSACRDNANLAKIHTDSWVTFHKTVEAQKVARAAKDARPSLSLIPKDDNLDD